MAWQIPAITLSQSEVVQGTTFTIRLIPMGLSLCLIKKLLQVRLTAIAILAAVSLSACIWSEGPKLAADPIAASVVKAGYYERCFFSVDEQTGKFVKSKDGCSTVLINVSSSGVITERSARDQNPGIMVINPLPSGALMVQSGGSAAQDKYVFGFLFKDTSQSDRISVIYPSCNFPNSLNRHLEQKFGFSNRDGGSNCGVGELPSSRIRALFDTLAETPGWTIEFKHDYSLIDADVGAQRFLREKQSAALKSR